MTREEKQLLLKELCARLPYGVKVNHFGVTRELLGVIPPSEPSENVMVGYDINDYEDSVIEDIKPYLRPMSSMTEEEKKEFQACHCVYELHPDFQPMMCNLANELNMFDWLNANHFDYRGLIPMGLALEAPDGMYKTE